MSLANLRELVKDDRIHVVAAVVAVLVGETAHYYVNTEGDVVVSCLVHQAGTPIWANLSALVGARGQGVWVIPDPGVEVMLGFDHGDFEGEAYLLACFPSGRSPAGLAPGKVFVIGMSVEVRSSSGTAAAVATKADVQAVVDYLKKQFDSTSGHTHSGNGAPPTEATTGSSGSAPSPTGTTVLKAE